MSPTTGWLTEDSCLLLLSFTSLAQGVEACAMDLKLQIPFLLVTRTGGQYASTRWNFYLCFLNRNKDIVYNKPQHSFISAKVKC